MANGHANGKKNGKTVKKTNGKRRHVLGPGPGRPKGLANRATREFKEIARGLVEDEQVQTNLLRRLRDGRADKIYIMLCHYAYGAPKQTMQLEPGDTPFVFTLKIDAPGDGDT